MSYENKVELLIGDAHGIYIPKKAMDFERLRKNGEPICFADKKILREPTNESYWDVWQEILDNAYLLDDKGNKWNLYQDGDLFAIRNDMTENDWKEWRGE